MARYVIKGIPGRLPFWMVRSQFGNPVAHDTTCDSLLRDSDIVYICPIYGKWISKPESSRQTITQVST